MNDLESLKSIFKDRLFKIPDYQRGYAWTTRQLQDFWEDAVNLPKDRYHYTGLLSLKRVERELWRSWTEDRWLIEDLGAKPFHVVDGQQRLTTFVVFIQCLYELLKSLPENEEKRDEEIYIGSLSLKQLKEEFLVVEKPPEFIIRTYKFGYETDNPSFRFLRHRILNEPDAGTLQETFYTLNLNNAKGFFASNLKSYLETYGMAELELLYKKVTQNLMFNLYEIGDDFDVFVAFETMNNRGKKLSNLELLKNRLIYLTTLYEENELADDDREALRSSINDAWKEVYYQLGRNKLNPLNDDDFLMAHWIMYFQYSRRKGDDYIRFLLDNKFTPQNIYEKTEIQLGSVEEFQEVREDDVDGEDIDSAQAETPVQTTAMRSKLTPGEILEYVNSLKSAAVHWYNTHNPSEASEVTQDEVLWLDRLNRIGIAYFRPLVAVSFMNSNTSSAERSDLFKDIERFIFLNFRMYGSMASYGSSEFNRACSQLLRGEVSIQDVRVLLADRSGYLFYTSEEEPDDKEFFDYSYFQKHLQKRFQNGGGGFYGWNGLRYFLYEYEMSKVRNRGSQKIDWKLFVRSEKDKVSIEHIYPQTPSADCWKSAFKGVRKNNLEYVKGSLGNLLPLSRSINSSLQNDCFEDKKKAKFNDKGDKVRQGYSDGSHSEIEVSAYTEWTPEMILERGLKLLDFLENRWNVTFENQQAKKELLFITFLDEDPRD